MGLSFIASLKFTGGCVVLLIILSLFYHRRLIIPFKYYLAMFTIPIAIGRISCLPSISLSKAIFRNNQICPAYAEDFIVIVSIVIFSFIVYISLQLILNCKLDIKREFKRLYLYFKQLCRNLQKIKRIFRLFFRLILILVRRLPNACANVIFALSISIVLLFVYIELYKSLFAPSYKSSGNSGTDLAICAAIVAACATLYNVQRTSKQESTKNRQDWITSVRFETANLIVAVDKIKLYERQRHNKCYYDYEKQENLFDSMIESCTKLRMLINPNDAVAPMITAQLDALANYYHNDFSNENNHICSIEHVDLRKSLMPWVLVLLKVEWERVKEILESREETRKDYYSKDIYGEWSGEKLKDYTLDNGGVALLRHIIATESDDKKINDKTLKKLFPGFYFCKKTKEKLKRSTKV